MQRGRFVPIILSNRVLPRLRRKEGMLISNVGVVAPVDQVRVN